MLLIYYTRTSMRPVVSANAAVLHKLSIQLCPEAFWSVTVVTDTALLKSGTPQGSWLGDLWVTLAGHRLIWMSYFVLFYYWWIRCIWMSPAKVAHTQTKFSFLPVQWVCCTTCCSWLPLELCLWSVYRPKVPQQKPAPFMADILSTVLTAIYKPGVCHSGTETWDGCRGRREEGGSDGWTSCWICVSVLNGVRNIKAEPLCDWWWICMQGQHACFNSYTGTCFVFTSNTRQLIL